MLNSTRWTWHRLYLHRLQRYRLKMLQRAFLKSLRQRLLWLSASFVAIKSIQERIAQLVILSVTDVKKNVKKKFAKVCRSNSYRASSSSQKDTCASLMTVTPQGNCSNQRWSPRGHILKSLALASKVKSLALASRPQVLENWPVLGSRTALFFELLKFCEALEKFFGKRFFVEIARKIFVKTSFFFFLEFA